jgi:hypothetical protein
VGQWQKLLSSRPTPSQSDASLIVALGRGGEWGPLFVATEKNAKVHSITLCFGHEGLVKTKLCIKVQERARARLPIIMENSKISQLEEKLEFPKVGLKS